MKKPTLKQLVTSKVSMEEQIKALRRRLRETNSYAQINRLRREIYAVNKEIERKL